jgi:hypothetical protein
LHWDGPKHDTLETARVDYVTQNHIEITSENIGDFAEAASLLPWNDLVTIYGQDRLRDYICIYNLANPPPPVMMSGGNKRSRRHRVRTGGRYKRSRRHRVRSRRSKRRTNLCK